MDDCFGVFIRVQQRIHPLLLDCLAARWNFSLHASTGVGAMRQPQKSHCFFCSLLLNIAACVSSRWERKKVVLVFRRTPVSASLPNYLWATGLQNLVFPVFDNKCREFRFSERKNFPCCVLWSDKIIIFLIHFISICQLTRNWTKVQIPANFSNQKCGIVFAREEKKQIIWPLYVFHFVFSCFSVYIELFARCFYLCWLALSDEWQSQNANSALAACRNNLYKREPLKQKDEERRLAKWLLYRCNAVKILNCLEHGRIYTLVIKSAQLEAELYSESGLKSIRMIISKMAAVRI